MNFNFDLYLLNEEVKRTWKQFEEKLLQELNMQQRIEFTKITVYEEGKEEGEMYTDEEEAFEDLTILKEFIEKIMDEFGVNAINFWPVLEMNDDLEDKIREAIEQDNQYIKYNVHVDEDERDLFGLLFGHPNYESFPDVEGEVFSWIDYEYDELIDEIDNVSSLIEFDHTAGEQFSDEYVLELFFKFDLDILLIDEVILVDDSTRYLIYCSEENDEFRPLAIEKELTVENLENLIKKENTRRRVKVYREKKIF